MQRRMLVLCVYCVFHALPSCHHHCSISVQARASAMQPQKRQRLETGLSLAEVIRSFGSPEAPSQEGFDAKQEEEPHTKEEEEEDVGAEEVVKEEPEPKEESVDAQEDLEEELAWKAEEDEEKEEEEEEGKYSQSTVAGTSTSASQSLSQESGNRCCRTRRPRSMAWNWRMQQACTRPVEASQI